MCKLANVYLKAPQIIILIRVTEKETGTYTL